MPRCIGLSDRNSSHASSSVGWPQSCPRRRASSDDDPVIVASLAGRIERLAHPLHAPLAVGHGAAVDLAPRGRGRQHHVGHARRSWSSGCPGRSGSRAPRAAPAPSSSPPRTAPGSRPSRTASAARHAPSPRTSATGASRAWAAARRPTRPRTGRAPRDHPATSWKPGQLVRDRAHVAAALDVVLTAQRVQARAVASDVPGQQREVDQREHVVDRGDVLGDPERPAQDRPVGAARTRAPARGSSAPGTPVTRSPSSSVHGSTDAAELLEAGRRVPDERLVGQARVDDLARDRVGERDVGADVEPQPRVGPLAPSPCGADRRRTATLRDERP